MAGTFVYWMNVSLDLMIGRDAAEGGDGDWTRITEELHREFNARARAMTMLIEGRVVYELMEASWPAAREDPGLPGFLREFGEIWTTKPKVLVSRTRTQAAFGTRVIGGDDAIAQLAALREQTEGELGVGGANLASQLLAAGLLDELLLFTHPAILGQGRPLFDPGTGLEEGGLTGLELIEQASFPQGVTMHRYAIGTARGTTPW